MIRCWTLRLFHCCHGRFRVGQCLLTKNHYHKYHKNLLNQRSWRPSKIFFATFLPSYPQEGSASRSICFQFEFRDWIDSLCRDTIDWRCNASNVPYVFYDCSRDPIKGKFSYNTYICIRIHEMQVAVRRVCESLYLDNVGCHPSVVTDTWFWVTIQCLSAQSIYTCRCWTPSCRVQESSTIWWRWYWLWDPAKNRRSFSKSLQRKVMIVHRWWENNSFRYWDSCGRVSLLLHGARYMSACADLQNVFQIEQWWHLKVISSTAVVLCWGVFAWITHAALGGMGRSIRG